MNTAVVNFKTDARTKREAQKVASALGLSLSAILSATLKELVRTRSVKFQVREEPSDHLIKALKKSEEDRKAGKYLSFDNANDALAFLDKMIEDDKS
jgi:DNA-damage-inducible protein J